MAPTTVHSTAHHFYDRQPLRVAPRLVGVIGSALHFLVKHDTSQHLPLGLFVVLRVDARGHQHYVGAQLSNPTLEDCLRLAKYTHVLHSMFRLDPSLPEELHLVPRMGDAL